MQKRIYKKGRPTTGWIRGKRIRSLSEIDEGDVVISVSDQFKSENLVKFVECPFTFGNPNERQYYVYAKPSGRRWGKTDGHNGAIMTMWNHELNGGQHRLFKAKKVLSFKGFVKALEKSNFTAIVGKAATHRIKRSLKTIRA